MDYKNYMGKMDKIYGISSNPYQSESGFESVYTRKASRPKSPSNVYYPPQPAMMNTTTGQGRQAQPQQGATPQVDNSYKQMLDNPLVSGVYSKGLVQSGGDKISAAEFAFREIMKAKDYVDNFTEDRQRRWTGGPGFTGNLQQDRNMLAGIASQLARYIDALYKNSAVQYR